MNDTVTVVQIGMGILCLWLMTKRWFWLLAFGVGGLAAAFTTLACIIHFQILGALGAFFLTGVCWFNASIIHDTAD
jgi:hypothetical protein